MHEGKLRTIATFSLKWSDSPRSRPQLPWLQRFDAIYIVIPLLRFWEGWKGRMVVGILCWVSYSWCTSSVSPK